MILLLQGEKLLMYALGINAAFHGFAACFVMDGQLIAATATTTIICSPRDALECFWSSPFDALVIGNYLIGK